MEHINQEKRHTHEGKNLKRYLMRYTAVESDGNERV